MISREEARAIVGRHLARTLIRDVRSSDEFDLRRAPLLAGVDLDDCWIAYVDQPRFIGLRSSEIVVVSKQTGEVVYAGPAGDEG